MEERLQKIGKKRNKLRYNQDKLEDLVKLLDMKCGVDTLKK